MWMNTGWCWNIFSRPPEAFGLSRQATASLLPPTKDERRAALAQAERLRHSAFVLSLVQQWI